MRLAVILIVCIFWRLILPWNDFSTVADCYLISIELTSSIWSFLFIQLTKLVSILYCHPRYLLCFISRPQIIYQRLTITSSSTSLRFHIQRRSLIGCINAGNVGLTVVSIVPKFEANHVLIFVIWLLNAETPKWSYKRSKFTWLSLKPTRH